MPTVRDGQGKLHTLEVELPFHPPGPIKRRQASAELMADIAAERARASQHDRRKSSPAVIDNRAAAAVSRQRGHEALRRARSVTEVQIADARASRAERDARALEVAQEEAMPAPQATLSPARNPAAKAANGEAIVTVLRETSSYTEASERLGINAHGIQQRVSRLRRAGLLPADVDAMLRARGKASLVSARQAAAAIRRGSKRTPSGYVPAVSPAGLTAGEHRRATKAALEAVGLREPDALPMHDAHPDSTLEDRQAHAAATPVANRGTTAPAAATQVATPAGPIPEAALALEGEDRCSFGTWLGQGVVIACDRPQDHDGRHRGRLIKLGWISETFKVIGHATVPA